MTATATSTSTSSMARRFRRCKKNLLQYWNRLFHNNHDGTFTDVTEKAGVAGTGYGMGVAVGDYDNDGWPDLFVANVTGNQLFHNNGDGTFTDVTAKARLGGALLDGKKMWSVGAGWFDYNNDGLLDLFVVNYCKWEVNKDPDLRAQRRVPRLLPSQVLRAVAQHALPKQRRRNLHRCFRSDGNRRANGERNERVFRRLRRRRLPRHVSWRTIQRAISCSTILAERDSKRLASKRA